MPKITQGHSEGEGTTGSFPASRAQPVGPVFWPPWLEPAHPHPSRIGLASPSFAGPLPLQQHSCFRSCWVSLPRCKVSSGICWGCFGSPRLGLERGRHPLIFVG